MLGNIMRSENGNALIISGIFIVIAIIIFIFFIAIFLGHINSILYNIKVDMFSINKSAIISINKNKGNIDILSYDKKAYKEYFEEALKSNYSLNDDLSNDEKLISKISIIEYDIIQKGKKDSFTKKKVDNTVIHTVINLKVRPIIMAKLLEDVFTFKIHEDVILNMVKDK
jgi:hypothetical protein